MTGVLDECEDPKEIGGATESEAVLPLKLLNEDSSEKTDSGMDEEMTQPSPKTTEPDSDSEDEPIVSKKKVKKAMVLDDDDDDDDNNGDNSDDEKDKDNSDDKLSEIGDSTKAPKKTLTEALGEIMDSDSDAEPSGTHETSDKKDAGSSSGDESDSLTDIIRKKKKSIKNTVDSSQDEGADQSEKASQLSQKKNDLFSSDLFDAEESDSDVEAPNKTSGDERSDKSGSDSDGSNNAEDEGFEDLDPKLKAKLEKMKGASKGGKKPRRGGDRKAKPKGESLMDIHSESQRLLRESQVVIPYHQPTPKPLNDFLARATKKQQDYRALRAVKEFKKPSVIQKVIDNCSPAVEPSSHAKKISPTQKDDTNREASAPKTDSQSHPDDTLASTVDSTINLESSSVVRNLDFDEDELPDLDEKSLSERLTLVNEETQKNKDKCDSAKETVYEKTTDENMEVDSDNTKPDDTLSAQDSHDKERENCLSEMKDDSVDKHTETSPGDSKDNNTQLDNSAVTKTPKLQLLGELKDLKPRLSGGPEAFIDFDLEADNNTPVASGPDKLFTRLLEHSKKKKHKHPKDVDISIVEKEAGPGDSTELKLTSITYHVDEEEEGAEIKKLEKPGAKLIALKETLQNKMKLKREEARQKRLELYQLENEEGFEEDNEEDKILDDDAEMSDQSDTDIEDDQFDAEFGEEEFVEEEEKKTNPFMDGEAEEDDEDYNPDNASNNGEDDIDEIDSDEEDGTMKLKLDTSGDEESDLENLSQNVRNSTKKKTKKHARQLTISDDEDSNLPGAQAITKDQDKPCFKIPKETTSPKESLEDEEDLSPLSKHLAPTQTQKLKKGISLPIEDSQDLYGDNTDNGLAFPVDTQPSQSLNFMMEDSQSQMLDADGFFKVKSTTKKPAKLPSGFTDISNTQDNMNELMGLCSGRFVEDSESSRKTSCKQLFGDGDAKSQDPSDELIGLCSGFFPGDASQKPKSQGVKRKFDEDEMSNDSFTLLSDNEGHMDSDKDELDDDNKENRNDFDEVDGDASRDSALEEKKFRGFRGKITGKLRREFVEDEAELSGSEAESDEDLDLAEEDDIMEMELGDQDVNLTEEELRNQVGRAHLKETIDSDKREIMRLQEMYLPDGDLTDGNGRMRRFRWKNMDDESQQDMFNGSDEDEAPEEDIDEQRWRTERFEREKFLQEEREKEDNEAGSQFFKFGKKFAVKIKEPISKPTDGEFKKPEKKEQNSPAKPMLRSASGRKGSFLTRSKEALAKIAEKTKSGVNPNATRNSRNFVFQHVSPDKSENTPQPKPVSKPAPHKKAASLQPPAKRQRTKTLETKPGNSIFNILEKK